jgi:hypothetical protein
VGVLAVGADARRPHRRRRPVVRRGDGARRRGDDAGSPPRLGRAVPAMAVPRGSPTTLFGLANGALVTFVRLPPFIVTLGTLNVAFASRSSTRGRRRCTDVPPAMTALGETFRVGATPVVYGAGAHARRIRGWPPSPCARQAAGRHVYAVGGGTRGGAPRGRAHAARPPRRLHARPGRCTASPPSSSWPAPAWRSQRGAGGEPRDGDRRGARRHQSVRRARARARLARRRAHRRRVPQRAHADGVSSVYQLLVTGVPS